jgi:hypothetical protein
MIITITPILCPPPPPTHPALPIHPPQHCAVPAPFLPVPLLSKLQHVPARLPPPPPCVFSIVPTLYPGRPWAALALTFTKLPAVLAASFGLRLALLVLEVGGGGTRVKTGGNRESGGKQKQGGGCSRYLGVWQEREAVVPCHGATAVYATGITMQP